MAEKPLLHHFIELQQCLKRFSLLAESKHESIQKQIEDLNEKSQRSYINKINYLALSNQMTEDREVGKTILFDKDISNVYSYSVISQIKDMLMAFKNDPYCLRLLIKDVILNWKRQDQIELAECLVN